MNSQVARLLDLVVDLPPEQRAQVLAEQCPDSQVRAEVESLLSYDTGSDDYFEDAVRSVAISLRKDVEPVPGDMVGAYRIHSLIGRGGMGSVYLAERADGELERRVAIKLLRAEWQRDVWRERFLRERQLLASMHHPAIVQVVDAGHTTAGRPFLVMEYVEGIAIDTYASGMAPRRVLRLFLKVCDGVAHAHRRLIIHRDLKPSNILVDSSGQPKLLDFGIGKLLDDTAEPTQTVDRLLTPNYASPEQLRGDPQTTATDVYSLGAVLYHLLTGEPPKTPAIPPSRIDPDVPRDLDFIIAKALRPEPEDRYASVDDFAADILAFLESRPVQVRSGDTWYRARRLARRHWLAAGAGILAAAGLTAGLWVANRERDTAERHFLEVRHLAAQLFDIDAEVAQLPGGSKARQLIVKTSLEYLQRVGYGSRMDPALELELGTAWMRVARVQGVNISANLGQTDEAERSSIKAQYLIDSVLAVRPMDRTALLRAAQIAHDRMTLAGDRRHEDESLQFAYTSADLFDRYLRAGTLPGHVDAQQVILALNNVAARFTKGGRYDDAISTCNRAIDLAHATNWPSQAGAALITLAGAYRAQGDLPQALKAARESVRILEPPPGETAAGRVLSHALALMREGQLLGEDDGISMGRTEEAIPALEEALRISDDYARRDTSNFLSQNRTFNSKVSLAAILRRRDPARALELYDDALRNLANIRSNVATPRNEAETLAASSRPLLQLGRPAEARRRLDSAMEILGNAGLYPARAVELGSPAYRVLRALAEFEAATGNPARALEIYTGMMPKRPAGNLADALDLSKLYRDAAPVLRRAGRAKDAAAYDARRMDLWREWSKKLPKSEFVQRQLQLASHT